MLDTPKSERVLRDWSPLVWSVLAHGGCHDLDQGICPDAAWRKTHAAMARTTVNQYLVLMISILSEYVPFEFETGFVR